MSNLKRSIWVLFQTYKKEFEYKNKTSNSKLEKIVVSAGLGLNAQNRVYLQKLRKKFV
jgi:ribosomal protein L5